MSPEEKTRELKEKAEQILTQLIDSDYLLLDVPHHSNLGDTLIWQGELDFLRTLPYECKYSTWSGGNTIIAENYLHRETIILFQGGGNFGDVWDEPNDFRKKVLSQYPNQKTIILPQTVYYKEEYNLKSDAAFYAQHPNVKICARDERSLQLLRDYFPNNTSLLVPDMAFCMDMKRYKRCNDPQGSIFIRREDKEFNEDINFKEVPNDAYVSDWIFLNNSKEYERQKEILKWASRFDHRLGTDWEHKWIDIYWHHVLRPLNVKTAINVIDKYAHIYTTRMHAAILSVILGKSEVTLFDNNYGKSSSLYYTWLDDVDGLKLVE